MTNILENPASYAHAMLELTFRNVEQAQTELYTAAKVHTSVPASFWRAVSKEIDHQAAGDVIADKLGLRAEPAPWRPAIDRDNFE